jgi:RNA polymerase primary sigma factor
MVLVVERKKRAGRRVGKRASGERISGEQASAAPQLCGSGRSHLVEFDSDVERVQAIVKPSSGEAHSGRGGESGPVPGSASPKRRSRRTAAVKMSEATIAEQGLVESAVETRLECVSHRTYSDHPETETIIRYESPFDAEAERLLAGATTKVPAGLPAYVASLYSVPLLGKAREIDLFLRMNYFRWKAIQLQKRLIPGRSTVGELEAFGVAVRRSEAIRNEIVQANLRLVVSIAKKFADQWISFDELVSEGNLPLIRAVELFDVSRGFRFSTYATWAIRNHLKRFISERVKQRTRFVNSDEMIGETPADDRGTATEAESRIMKLRGLLRGVFNKLSDREQRIVSARFGLEDKAEPQTLAEIGRELGISKERVRQLATQAVEKIRRIVTGDPTANPLLMDAPV